MKYTQWRSRGARILIVCPIILLMMACDPVAGGIGDGSADSTSLLLKIKPELPDGLAAWRDRICWRLSGSMLEPSSGNSWILVSDVPHLQNGSSFSPGGDWLLCEPCVLGSDGRWYECGLPVLGWTSAGAVVEESGGDHLALPLDGVAGLMAKILADYERSGGDWAGLNLWRFDQEVREQQLDSLKADFWRIFQGIVDRDIAVYDLSPRAIYQVVCQVPDGVWLDAYGKPCQVDTVGNGLELQLPLGTSWLFQADGQAWLVVRVWLAGNGKPRALAAPHHCP